MAKKDNNVNFEEAVRWIDKPNIKFIKSADVLPITSYMSKFDYNVTISQLVQTVKDDTDVNEAILHPRSDGLSHQQVINNKTDIELMYDKCIIGRINRRIRS